MTCEESRVEMHPRDGQVGRETARLMKRHGGQEECGGCRKPGNRMRVHSRVLPGTAAAPGYCVSFLSWLYHLGRLNGRRGNGSRAWLRHCNHFGVNTRLYSEFDELGRERCCKKTWTGEKGETLPGWVTECVKWYSMRSIRPWWHCGSLYLGVVVVLGTGAEC